MERIKDSLGRELKDLRISVIDACNFRCPYCMPKDAFAHHQFFKKDELLTFEEITRLVRCFAALGVNKIRLTGGEPLLRNHLEQLVVMIAKIPEIEDIALTTNGYFLKEKAASLKDAGLKRITVSLDALDEEIFKKMAGRNVPLEQVLQGIGEAVDVGFPAIKTNTVILRHVNESEIIPLAAHFKGTKVVVRYIEYMDVGNVNGWNRSTVFTAEEIISLIDDVFPIEPLYAKGSDVASYFRYQDGSGQIGVIASVTKPFCRSCVRARLSADGKFYTCLFSSQGTDLRHALRSNMSDEEITLMIRKIWLGREDRYSELRQSLSSERGCKKIEMYKIGG